MSFVYNFKTEISKLLKNLNINHFLQGRNETDISTMNIKF